MKAKLDGGNTPKLLDGRFFSCMFSPYAKGVFFACCSAFLPFVFMLALIRGELGPFRVFPWAGSCPVEQADECELGLVDFVPSSYSGETKISATTPGVRRQGRTGAVLNVLGFYAFISALKLLIPPGKSSFYVDKEKHQRDPLLDELEDKDTHASETEEEKALHTKNPDGSNRKMPQIFTVLLWKRSALTLIILVVAVMQMCIMELSFKDNVLVRNNLLIFLVLIHFLRLVFRRLIMDMISDSLLVVPITTMTQVTFMITILGARTLYNFLECFMFAVGLRLIDRLYLNPNEDYAVARVTKAFRNVRSYLKSVNTGDGKAADDEGHEDEDELLQNPEWHDTVDNDDGQTAEGDMEDMISFCASLSTDAIGNFVAPLFFLMSMWFYEDTNMINNFGIPKEVDHYYAIFYFMMLFFLTAIDLISINIVDIYHGWHVLDYLEFCQYRFKRRQADWKMKEHSYDESLSPHQRSIDQLCFSEQYYYAVSLCTLGIFCWMIGMQIIINLRWNVFDDPATPVVLFCTTAFCKGVHITISQGASYLKIWVVKTNLLLPQQMQQMGMGSTLDSGYPSDVLGIQRQAIATALGQNVAKPGAGFQGVGPYAIPVPPPGSVHEAWPEPMSYDVKGMERYRRAFLLENAQWLQATFSELRDKTVMTQHREALLEQLAFLLKEVPISAYAPEPEGGYAEKELAFGAAPAAGVARAAGEVQRQAFQGSIAQEVIRMWYKRAQFMVLLERISAMVKLEYKGAADRCEICGRTEPLVVTPIYTLMHIASMYRQQRDMSPLWNTPLWKHFYSTTPCCTLCDRHARQYHIQNQNVPVDEQRFKRLSVAKKTAHDVIMESDIPIVPIQQDTAKVLMFWLCWSRELAAGNDPREFLPKYGFEGRMQAEIRKETLAAAKGDEETQEYEDSDEEREAKKEAEKEERRLLKLKITEEAMDKAAAEDEDAAAVMEETPLVWSDKAILLQWLKSARQSLQAPQLADWTRPIVMHPPGGDPSTVRFEDQ
mmetsp:Transcript_10571/g.23308  ORF Transcript_10571/g.23308 Transcript_10571/m.23308 type:complete len:1002 (-) Transcript_10571:37-3042(-)